MQFGVGIEYAFHTLFYMVDIPTGGTIGIKELAELNQVSETYLSKVFTKLRKAGIVRSVPGAKGGYELAKKPDEISFWDVVEAVEGASYAFQCAEIRQNNILIEQDYDAPRAFASPCLIKSVMQEAEDQMRDYLRQKNLGWLYRQVMPGFSDDRKASIADWIEQSTN